MDLGIDDANDCACPDQEGTCCKDTSNCGCVCYPAFREAWIAGLELLASGGFLSEAMAKRILTFREA